MSTAHTKGTEMTTNTNNSKIGGKTSIKTYREALNDAIREEMRRDPTVIVLGEEVSGGAGCDGQDDAYGGLSKVALNLE
jgi:hypothetical protein